MSQLLLLVCTVMSFFQFTTCQLQLKMLHVVFRHGDKVPHREFQNYPNDPHRNHSFLPFDNGDLTNEGRMREYRIGLMLRGRYDEYFGPGYWPSLIYAQTTALPRTRMSLQLVLAGLFPSTEKTTWNPQLPWNPVDFVSVPFQKDYILFPQYCSKYRKEYAYFLEQNEVKNRLSIYKQVMSYITRHSGKSITDLKTVNYMYGLFKEEESQNLTLPEWTKKVYPHPMIDMTKMDFHLRSYTKTLKRLNGGTLLRRVTDDMKLVREKTLIPAARKASLYSGHEHNIAALAYVLGIQEGAVPTYGSTIILETLRDEADKYYVRIFYWKADVERLILQMIPNCPEICPLDEFLRLLSDVIPGDEEFFCHGRDAAYDTQTPNTASFAQGKTSLFLFVLVSLILQRVIN